MPPAPTATLIDKQSEDSRPLYFVNNSEVQDFKQAKLDPDGIKSSHVLKPSTTDDLVRLYGPKAKNRIIFVTTKSRK